MMPKSWITMLAGVVVIVTALVALIMGKMTWEQAGPIIIAGLGLLAAKDFNVTGGTK